MTITTVQSREARTQWRSLLDKVQAGGMDVLIERNGKPVAVLIPIEDYQEMQDALDELRASRRVSEAYAEYQAHPESARTWEEVRSELVKEGKLDE